MSGTKSPKKNEVDQARRRFPKKTLLFSSHDLTKMAEQSSRARLIKQVAGADDLVRKSFEKYFTKCTYPASPENETAECKQYITAYPSKGGLRWNPCVEVSSGEEASIQPEPQRPKNSCNCAECTSLHCPSKRSLEGFRTVFKDNIKRFRDNTTMTPKLNHASCSARTPLASPKTSILSLSATQTQTRIDTQSTGYYQPTPKAIFKKPILRNEYYRDPWYDEAVRDTDYNQEEEYPYNLNTAHRRHCVVHPPDLQFESGKINLYNEGISEKVVERCPVTPPQCPYKLRFGSKSFCRNMCVDCNCPPPSSKTSKYHQRCKRAEYKGPVYYEYDVDPDEIERVVTVPRFVTERYVIPPGRPTRAPPIMQPRRMLTSERDIEPYLKDEKVRRRHKKGK